MIEICENLKKINQHENYENYLLTFLFSLSFPESFWRKYPAGAPTQADRV